MPPSSTRRYNTQAGDTSLDKKQTKIAGTGTVWIKQSNCVAVLGTDGFVYGATEQSENAYVLKKCPHGLKEGQVVDFFFYEGNRVLIDLHAHHGEATIGTQEPVASECSS